MEGSCVSYALFVNQRFRGFSIRSLKTLVVQFLILPLFALQLSFSSAMAADYEPIHSNSVHKITIARGIGNYAPLEMIRDGKLTGLHVDLINYAASKLGIEVEFLSLPWGKALKAFSAGDIDAISYFSYTKERAEFTYYYEGNILSDTKWVFIALEEREQNFSIDTSLAGLEDYVIGVQEGYSYGEYFDHKDDLKRNVVVDVKDLERSLNSKTHDLAIISYQEFLAFKEQGYFEGIISLTPALSSDSQYLAFSKSKSGSSQLKNVAELFAKELELFKRSDDYRALLERYDFYHYQ